MKTLVPDVSQDFRRQPPKRPRKTSPNASQAINSTHDVAGDSDALRCILLVVIVCASAQPIVFDSRIRWMESVPTKKPPDSGTAVSGTVAEQQWDTAHFTPPLMVLKLPQSIPCGA